MLKSKIFWTQIATILGVLLSIFGFDLTDEQTAAIVTVLCLLDTGLTMVFRKWFNHKNTEKNNIGMPAAMVLILIGPLVLAGCAGMTPLEKARTYGYETSNVYLNLDREYRAAWYRSGEEDQAWLGENVRPLLVKAKAGLITYNDTVLLWSRLAERAKAMGEDPYDSEEVLKPEDVEANQVRLDDLLLSVVNLISKFRYH